MSVRRSFNVYTDREFLPPGIIHCALLKPYWGDPETHNGYDTFTNEGNQFLKLTSLEDAEIAALPFDASFLLSNDPAVASVTREAATRFVEMAAARSLRTLMLCNSDWSTPIGLENAVLLRTSIDKSRQLPGEFALPAWFENLVGSHLGGSIVVRDKTETPVVGFCGFAASRKPRPHRRLINAAKSLARRVGVRIPHKDGLYLRKRAMDALQATPGIKTNFIVRDQFFGGGINSDIKERVRREYVDNLVSSDYVLCVRGYGNFSFRFYESLSIGRIPVLIDTDCALPYDFLHDYKEFCVIVPEREIDRIGEHILKFHARFSPEGFRELQERNRRFWLEWLSPEGFFRNIPLHWDRSANRSSDLDGKSHVMPEVGNP